MPIWQGLEYGNDNQPGWLLRKEIRPKSTLELSSVNPPLLFTPLYYNYIKIMTDKEVIDWCRKSLQDSKPVFWMDKLTKLERVAVKVLLAVSVLPLLVILWIIAQILTWMMENQI